MITREAIAIKNVNLRLLKAVDFVFDVVVFVVVVVEIVIVVALLVVTGHIYLVVASKC